MIMDKDAVCYKCGTKDDIKVHYKSYRGDKKYVLYVCRPCNRAKTKKYYDKCRVSVFEHYGNICACCGETNDLFLSIDHINNDGHLEVWKSGKRIGGRQLYQKIVKADYPNKYQLLCMNCNYGKRMNGGICPHKV